MSHIATEVQNRAKRTIQQLNLVINCLAFITISPASLILCLACSIRVNTTLTVVTLRLSLEHSLVPASPGQALFQHLPNISKFSVFKL
jgi:hypothetical protein